MLTTRRRRIIRRAVMALVVVVLLLAAFSAITPQPDPRFIGTWMIAPSLQRIILAMTGLETWWPHQLCGDSTRTFSISITGQVTLWLKLENGCDDIAAMKSRASRTTSFRR